jgi:hypothetical protein
MTDDEILEKLVMPAAREGPQIGLDVGLALISGSVVMCKPEYRTELIKGIYRHLLAVSE